MYQNSKVLPEELRVLQICIHIAISMRQTKKYENPKICLSKDEKIKLKIRAILYNWQIANWIETRFSLSIRPNKAENTNEMSNFN